MDLILIILSFVISIYLANFISRYISYGKDNVIINTFSLVFMIIFSGISISIGSDYLIKVFNPPYYMDSIYIILLLFMIIIGTSVSLFITKSLMKVKFSKLEYKIIASIENNEKTHNSKVQKIISAIGLLFLFAIITGFLFSGVSIYDLKEKDIKEIQILGVLKEPSYTDNRGYNIDTKYEIYYKFTDENFTRTINNDNYNTAKLEEYYNMLKDNIESKYSANVYVLKSSKNPDDVSCELIDININKKEEAK